MQYRLAGTQVACGLLLFDRPDEDFFLLKMCLYETPFYITMAFKFVGNELQFDSEYNVNFGPTKLAQLVGTAQ